MKQTKKSLETKSLIYNKAIQLFQEKGFENVTMREISKELGLSLGLTYYYFKTKEELVFEFYKNIQSECEIENFKYFQLEKNFEKRIKHILEIRLNYFAPYSNFLHVLAKLAGHPNHPLSPFSMETKEIRERAIYIFQTALNDSNIKITSSLKEVLPEALWLYQLGIIYFWLWDNSANKEKTHQLINLSLGLIIKLIKFLNLPITKPFHKPIVQIHKLLHL